MIPSDVQTIAKEICQFCVITIGLDRQDVFRFFHIITRNLRFRNVIPLLRNFNKLSMM